MRVDFVKYELAGALRQLAVPIKLVMDCHFRFNLGIRSLRPQVRSDFVIVSACQGLLAVIVGQLEWPHFEPWAELSCFALEPLLAAVDRAQEQRAGQFLLV